MKQESQLKPVTLIVVSSLARLLPHPPNFTPVGSISLFAGAKLAGWQAYLIPLLIMAISDPLLHILFGMPGYTALSPFIYLSLMLNVVIGRKLLRQSENAIRIGCAAFLCSMQFFVITNFGVWVGSHFFAHTLAGLLTCYTAAIPFFGRTLAGDLFFSAVLFGLYRLIRSLGPRLQTA